MTTPTQAFVDDILAVYNKHGLGLDSVEGPGLCIVPLEESHVQDLKAAAANLAEDLARAERRRRECPASIYGHVWAAGTDPMVCAHCNAAGPPLPGCRSRS